MKSLILRLLHLAQVDRAVFYGVMGKAWAFLSGPVSLLLISYYFTPSLQGYYYTFSSLLALQVFLELGLSQVIIQFASHEWAKLSFDENRRVIGDGAALVRLRSLGRSMFLWYVVAGFLFMVALSIGGTVFFAHSSSDPISWQAPWIGLSVLAGFNMFLIPILALLEGCNQVAPLNMFRFIQGVFGSVVIWAAIYWGAGLWTSVFLMAANVGSALVFILWRYRRFIEIFIDKTTGVPIAWGGEIWPLQWRIALSWLSGYFSFSMFTPTLFKYEGSVVAGQMGMTWNMLSAVTAVSSMWVMVRVPAFGILVSKKDFPALDRQFYRSAIFSFLVALFGTSAVWLLVFFLLRIRHPLGERCLPLLPTALFCLGSALLQVSASCAAYLRAHKREPFLIVSLLQGGLTAVCTVFLGRRFGAVGVAGGYLGVIALLLPFATFTWYWCRKNWHAAMLRGDREMPRLSNFLGF